MEQLFELVEAQLKEREETPKKMQQSRESWQLQLQEATSQLKQMMQAGETQIIDADMEDLDDEADSAAVQDKEQEAARSARESAKHQQLKTALAAAREAAMLETGRERTPRRRKGPLDEQDLSDGHDDAKVDPWTDPKPKDLGAAAGHAKPPDAAQASSRPQGTALQPFGKAHN